MIQTNFHHYCFLITFCLSLLFRAEFSEISQKLQASETECSYYCNGKGQRKHWKNINIITLILNKKKIIITKKTTSKLFGIEEVSEWRYLYRNNYNYIELVTHITKNIINYNKNRKIKFMYWWNIIKLMWCLWWGNERISNKIVNILHNILKAKDSNFFVIDDSINDFEHLLTHREKLLVCSIIVGSSFATFCAPFVSYFIGCFITAGKI